MNMSEHKHEIRALNDWQKLFEMLDAAAKAVCEQTHRSEDFDHIAEGRKIAQAAFDAAGVGDLLARIEELERENNALNNTIICDREGAK
jgi:hypothetical protein